MSRFQEIIAIRFHLQDRIGPAASTAPQVDMRKCFNAQEAFYCNPQASRHGDIHWRFSVDADATTF
jgi:hypothetical protein